MSHTFSNYPSDENPLVQQVSPTNDLNQGVAAVFTSLKNLADIAAPNVNSAATDQNITSDGSGNLIAATMTVGDTTGGANTEFTFMHPGTFRVAGTDGSDNVGEIQLATVGGTPSIQMRYPVGTVLFQVSDTGAITTDTGAIASDGSGNLTVGNGTTGGLVIQGHGNTQPAILLNDASGSQQPVVQFTDSGADFLFGCSVGADGGNNFFIYDNNSGNPCLYIDGTNNDAVYIGGGTGDDGSGYPLQVAGNVSASNVTEIVVSVGRDRNSNYVCAATSGSGNDATQIQDAITYVEGLGGGKIIVKPGTYYLETAITINSGNLWIQGSGQSTILYRKSATNDVFYTASQSGNENNYYNNLSFSDFMVTGVTATGGSVFNLNSVGAPHIYNIRTAQPFGATWVSPTAYNGVTINGIMSDCLIENCTFMATNNCIGVTDLDGAVDGVIRNCWLQGASGASTGYGVYLSGVGGCKVIACEIQNHTYGIYSTGAVGGLQISDCFCDSNTNGIYSTGDSSANTEIVNTEVLGGITLGVTSSVSNVYGNGTITVNSSTGVQVSNLQPYAGSWSIANSGTLQIQNSVIGGSYSGSGTLYSLGNTGLKNVLVDFGSAPTSTSGGGTAGTTNQLASHAGILYLCTSGGTAGSATWTKVSTTSV